MSTTLLTKEDSALLLLLATLGRRRRLRLGRRSVTGARHVGQAALAAVPAIEVRSHEAAAALGVGADLPVSER